MVTTTTVNQSQEAHHTVPRHENNLHIGLQYQADALGLLISTGVFNIFSVPGGLSTDL